MADETKRILPTGSTDGVGRRVAERLAKPGNTLLVHGHNRERGESLVEPIGDLGGTASFYAADVASRDGIRRPVGEVPRDHARLDVLVNNAGVGVYGAYQGRSGSRDGLVLRFAVNHLAGFLPSRLLLPLLETRPAARIVHVASVGQRAVYFSDVMLTRGYGGKRSYCRSKLARIPRSHRPPFRWAPACARPIAGTQSRTDRPGGGRGLISRCSHLTERSLSCHRSMLSSSAVRPVSDSPRPACFSPKGTQSRSPAATMPG